VRRIGHRAHCGRPDHFPTVWTLPGRDRDDPPRWRLVKGGFNRECKTERVRNGPTPVNQGLVRVPKDGECPSVQRCVRGRVVGCELGGGRGTRLWGDGWAWVGYRAKAQAVEQVLAWTHVTGGLVRDGA